MTRTRWVVIHARLYLTFLRVMILMCWIVVHCFIIFVSELSVCCPRSLGLWSAHMTSCIPRGIISLTHQSFPPGLANKNLALE